MDKLLEYAVTNWPGLAIFIGAAVIIFVLSRQSTENLKLSVDSLRTANQDLREQISLLKEEVKDLSLSNSHLSKNIADILEKWNLSRDRTNQELTHINETLGQLDLEIDSLHDGHQELRHEMKTHRTAVLGLHKEQSDRIEKISTIVEELANHVSTINSHTPHPNEYKKRTWTRKSHEKSVEYPEADELVIFFNQKDDN